MSTIYRATTTDETGIPLGSCWAEDYETAEAYTDNPGFGGPHIREIELAGEILDITGGSLLAQFRALAAALDMDEEDAEDWKNAGYLYPWEESGKVRRALNASAYDWLRYEDDYPDGAITLMRISDNQ